MSLYELSDDTVKKILSRLALLGIFIPSHVSDREILYKYKVEEIEGILESKGIDFTWLVEREAITEQGNTPASFPPPRDLEEAVAGPSGVTGPTLRGIDLFPYYRPDAYNESNKGDEFNLGDIGGKSTNIYNRTTLIRLLMAMGYFYFEEQVDSITRLVDWELKYGKLPNGMTPFEFSSHMRTKSYFSAQSRENLVALLKRRLELQGKAITYIFGNIKTEDLTKDMLIFSLINWGTIFVGLNKEETYKEGSLYRGPILPEDDMTAFKGNSVEAIGNRYRRSATFKVATLKLFEGTGIKTRGLDQTVYAIISKSQRFFLVAMLTEYLLQNAKPVGNSKDYLNRDFETVEDINAALQRALNPGSDVEDLGGIDNLNLEQVISLADPYITPDTAKVVLSIIGDIPLNWSVSIFKQMTDYFVKYLLTPTS